MTRDVPFNEAKTQREKVLAYLTEHTTITPLRAVSEFGEYRLAARIHELRNEGFWIYSIVKTTMNGRRYVEYELDHFVDPTSGVGTMDKDLRQPELPY
jgi:hypothetical protein